MADNDNYLTSTLSLATYENEKSDHDSQIYENDADNGESACDKNNGDSTFYENLRKKETFEVVSEPSAFEEDRYYSIKHASPEGGYTDIAGLGGGAGAGGEGGGGGRRWCWTVVVFLVSCLLCLVISAALTSVYFIMTTKTDDPIADSFLCPCYQDEEGENKCICYECLTSSSTDCKNKHRCSLHCDHFCTVNNSVESCSCHVGFTYNMTDVAKCIDIDECSGEHICDQGCINSDGSYKCSCRDQFILHTDGHSCIAIGVNNCSNADNACDQICYDIGGSTYCACLKGYILAHDGHTCSDINECESNIHGCSHICINTKGSYRCECNDSFFLVEDGKRCYGCPPNFTAVFESCYWQGAGILGWNRADQYCADQFGGHLIALETETETERLYANIASGDSSLTLKASIWIGLSDFKKKGQYVWVTGEPFSGWFTIHSSADYDCVFLPNILYPYYDMVWTSKPCYVTDGFICELPAVQ